jgi:nucleotide-binding universal stress UspA family protein
MASGQSWLSGPVVVPLDGRGRSLRATYFATRLAELLDVSLRLISVVEGEREANARLAWLREVARSLPGDVPNEIEVLVGDDAAASIVADVGDHGLVCMATAGKVRFHSGHFGSIAEDVVRALDRPVVLVGPQVDPEPASGTRKIVVPVDGSDASTSAFAPAADLAAVLDVPLWLISVVSPLEVAAATHGAPVAAREYELVPRLAARLAADRNITVEHEVIASEHPARVIVEAAGDEGTVVMSTHGRSGLRRVFAGSITAEVVAHSHRPVAVLRSVGSR